MAESTLSFVYKAMASDGRRVRGRIEAASASVAHARLKAQGLSPIKLAKVRNADRPRGRAFATIRDQEIAECLAELGALLGAGSDIRTALSVLAAKSGRAPIANLCRSLSNDIASGDLVDVALAKALPKRFASVPSIVAAGLAAGDLPGAFARCGDLIATRVSLRRQLISSLSYPAFVFASSILAILFILLVVVPSLTPLIADLQGEPPPVLYILISASEFLAQYGLAVGVVWVVIILFFIMGHGVGLFVAPADRALLDGPFRGTIRSLTFGGFAVTLGGMLASGTPMAEALRLAIQATGNGLARRRLEPVLSSVRQGVALSDALGQCHGVPRAIVRLAAVGETTGTLGTMLHRVGALEEAAALRRIEALGQLLGPALIALLGGVIGLTMAALLSGIAEIGKVALK